MPPDLVRARQALTGMSVQDAGQMVLLLNESSLNREFSVLQSTADSGSLLDVSVHDDSGWAHAGDNSVSDLTDSLLPDASDHLRDRAEGMVQAVISDRALQNSIVTYDKRGGCTRKMNSFGKRKLTRRKLVRRKCKRGPRMGMMGIFFDFDPAKHPQIARKMSEAGAVDAKLKPNQPFTDSGRWSFDAGAATVLMRTLAEVRVKYPNLDARYLIQTKDHTGKTVYVDVSGDAADVVGLFNHSTDPFYRILLHVKPSGAIVVEFIPTGKQIANIDDELTINYDLSFGFQQDDEVAEEDLELTYSEKLDSVKSREHANKAFGEAIKKVRGRMHKSGAKLDGSADENRPEVLEMFHVTYIRCILDYMLNIIINIDFDYIHLATPTNLGVKGIVQIKELEGYAQRLLGEAQLRTFRAADFTSQGLRSAQAQVTRSS
eukprot:COSAG01_NODE_345_length_18538_cov_64.139433_12_plen_432_part_00